MQKRSERGGHGVRNRRKKERGGWGGRKGGRKRGENPGKKRINHPKKAQNAGKHLCVFPGSDIPYDAPFPIYTFSFLSPSLHRVYFALKDANIDFLSPPPPPSSQPLPIPMRRLFSFRPGEGGGWEEGRRAPWRYEGRIQRYQTAAKQILVCAPLYFQGWARRDGGDEDGTLILSIPTKKEMRGEKNALIPSARLSCVWNLYRINEGCGQLRSSASLESTQIINKSD